MESSQSPSMRLLDHSIGTLSSLWPHLAPFLWQFCWYSQAHKCNYRNGLTWLITPSYPLFKISLMMSSNGTFIDNVLQWVLFASMLDELSTFVKIMEIPEHSLWKYLAELWEIVYSKIIISSFYFISSSFSYYVVYWFIPRFISDFFFLLGVYVFIPLGILRRLKYSISKILKGSYVLTGDRKKLLMKFNMIIMLTAIVIVLVSLINFWV